MRRPVLTLAVLASSLLATACSTGLRGDDRPVAAALQAAPAAPLAVAEPVTGPVTEPVSEPVDEPGAAVPRTVRPAKRVAVLERTESDGRRVRTRGAEPVPRRAWFELTPDHPAAPGASR